MRAFRFHGSKSGARLEDVPTPSAGSGSDLLVRVSGAGVCRTDLHILDGSFDSLISQVPFVMGHETVGWVQEGSPALPDWEKGDPVIVYPQSTCGICPACRAGNDMGCDRGRFYGLDGTDGGFADYMKVSGRCLIPIPQGQDPVQLAPLADAGLTAYHAVRGASSSLRPSGAVLVIGVGGVGQMAIQLLRIMTPAEIIAVDAAESKLRLAEGLGADHAVHTSSGQEEKEVLELAGGKGVDVVFDFVGETQTTKLALGTLAPGGLYSVVGYGGEISAPTMRLVASQVRIQGNLVGTFNELAELVKLFVSRRLKVEVERRPLDKAGDVLSDLRGGSIRGRAVLIP